MEGILEDYRKQVKMPGFRPGKVPIQLVRKQYGKAVLADELNKILGERLDGYIREQKLRLLGQPIPTVENESDGNWDKPEVFTFRYDIGLSPTVDIKFGWFTKFVNHKVRIDELLHRRPNWQICAAATAKCPSAMKPVQRTCSLANS